MTLFDNIWVLCGFWLVAIALHFMNKALKTQLEINQVNNHRVAYLESVVLGLAAKVHLESKNG